MSKYQVGSDVKVAKLVVTAAGVNKIAAKRLGVTYNFDAETGLVKEGKDVGLDYGVFNEVTKGGLFSLIRSEPADGSTPFLMLVATGDIKPV